MIDREAVITHLDDLRLFADVTVHPVVSPNNWDVYSSLCDYIDQIKTEVEILLKEQEPVPPNWMQNENGIWNTCKRCGYILKPAILDKEPEKQKMFFYFPKFCSECGQAVKWK